MLRSFKNKLTKKPLSLAATHQIIKFGYTANISRPNKKNFGYIANISRPNKTGS